MRPKSIDFKQVVESPGELKFYMGLFERILLFLREEGGASGLDILRYAGGSDRRLVRLLDQMVKARLIRFRNGYFWHLGEASGGISRRRENLCSACAGKIVNVHNGKNEQLLKKMQLIYRLRPTPTFLFDQRPVTAKTTTERALYMLWRGDLLDKDIAVIGDDDLTSLALGFTRQANRVVVFEIDKRLVRFINTISKKYNLRVRAIEQDIFKAVPRQYQQKFDIFVTDPTPNEKAFQAFTIGGTRFLRRYAGAVGYISLYPSHSTKTLGFQKILTRLGFIITDVIPFFTEYEVIEATFSPRDIELMKKYGFSRSSDRFSFTESLVRIEAISSTKFAAPQAHSNSFMIMGKATKRVLNDPAKDPALHAQDTMDSYLAAVLERMRKNSLSPRRRK